MPYNYSKLRGRIVEKFQTQQKFARAIGMSERSLSLKLNGKRGWRQPEIEKACAALNLTESDISNYFFALEVQVA